VAPGGTGLGCSTTLAIPDLSEGFFPTALPPHSVERFTHEIRPSELEPLPRLALGKMVHSPRIEAVTVCSGEVELVKLLSPL